MVLMPTSETAIILLLYQTPAISGFPSFWRYLVKVEPSSRLSNNTPLLPSTNMRSSSVSTIALSNAVTWLSLSCHGVPLRKLRNMWPRNPTTNKFPC